MTKPPKNAIFKAETALFQEKWNPCCSDIVSVEMKDTESLPSGNNNYLWTIKACVNNSSVSRVQAPLILESQEFRQVHHLMFLNYSAVILLGPGIYGHILMILLMFK